MQKIKIVEYPEFTKTYPADHRTHITVTTGEGRQAVGESGAGDDNLSSRKTQAQIADKFRGLAEKLMGAQRADVVLARIWKIEDLGNFATLISDFAPAK